MPKSMKQKAPKGPGATVGDHISDPRFANIQTDPRFRLPSKKNTHVQIDKRFAHMLRDEDFSSRAKVDRYGRKLPKYAGRTELKKFYRIADEDDESKDDVDEEEEVVRELERVHAIDEESLSSSEESSSEEDLEESEEEVFGLLGDQEGADGIPKGEVSSRIAVVNLDWDNIRAADLMAVFSSFVPGSGRIRKISIYPSEFGKERVEREEMEGPPKEIFGQRKENGALEEDSSESEGEYDQQDEADDDEQIKKSMLKEDSGQEFNSAKLRRYQLERLRYYYAVLECSSISTAQTLYNAVDGTEYLTTANFFDLRYIPNDVDFTEDRARDECERIPDGYRPNEFVTDALQHSKVRLTWDADDGSRKEAQKRAFAGSRADIDENDLKAYLGSDSSGDEERPEPVVVDGTVETQTGISENCKEGGEPITKSSKKEAERQRMRALLGLQGEPVKAEKSKEPAPVGDMQITFSSGLLSGPSKTSAFENEPDRGETTVEKYFRKEKVRKVRRKEKMKATRDGEELIEDPEHREVNSMERNSAEDKDLGFSDPFFSASTNGAAGTAVQRKGGKRLRRKQREANEAVLAAKRAELELLMVDDDTGSKEMQHFDINEIAKAEKALSRKKKSKKKLTEREREALAAKERDNFKMNVEDERFKDVFESADFAIDPSHPKYKGTEGMKELLDEGRRKRKVNADDGGGADADHDKRKKKSRKGEVGSDEADVETLIARVKNNISG